jgi:hypothetical protein
MDDAPRRRTTPSNTVFSVEALVTVKLTPEIAFRLSALILDTLPRITPIGKVPDAQLMALGHHIKNKLDKLNESFINLYPEEDDAEGDFTG